MRNGPAARVASQARPGAVVGLSVGALGGLAFGPAFGLEAGLPGAGLDGLTGVAVAPAAEQPVQQPRQSQLGSGVVAHAALGLLPEEVRVRGVPGVLAGVGTRHRGPPGADDFIGWDASHTLRGTAWGKRGRRRSMPGTTAHVCSHRPTLDVLEGKVPLDRRPARCPTSTFRKPTDI